MKVLSPEEQFKKKGDEVWEQFEQLRVEIEYLEDEKQKLQRGWFNGSKIRMLKYRIKILEKASISLCDYTNLLRELEAEKLILVVNPKP